MLDGLLRISLAAGDRLAPVGSKEGGGPPEQPSVAGLGVKKCQVWLVPPG